MTMVLHLIPNYIDVINFDDFLMMTNSDITIQKENVDVFNMSKQGMQGAWLNETWELTDEGDITNQNLKWHENEIKSLRTKSVLLGKTIEFEQNNIPSSISNGKDLDNTISSWGSLNDIDESTMWGRKTTSIKLKGINHLYKENPFVKTDRSTVKFGWNWNNDEFKEQYTTQSK